ncbi:MAG: hypothetical protein AAGC66_13525 [Leifsonia sp.]
MPVVGGTRSPSGGQRVVAFDDPEALDLREISTLVIVSAGYAEHDRVIARHTVVIDAAVRYGVTHVVYTSVTADGDHLRFALAHRATERLVRASGLNWTMGSTPSCSARC